MFTYLIDFMDLLLFIYFFLPGFLVFFLVNIPCTKVVPLFALFLKKLFLQKIKEERNWGLSIGLYVFYASICYMQFIYLSNCFIFWICF